EGKDVLLKAETRKDRDGTIVIPALEKFSQIEDQKGTHILIVTPNGKEVQQIDELIRAMGHYAQIECASIDAESDRAEQERAVTHGVPVLVANPARLLD